MRCGGVRGGGVRSGTVRSGGVRLAVVRGSGVRWGIMRGRSMRVSGIATPVRCPFAVRVYDRFTAGISVIADEAAGISSAAGGDKAMAAPTVVISPTGPRTHAQEDAVVEVARPVITNRGAGIRCIAVIAVRTDRWWPPYADGNLRIRFWRKGQGRKQSCAKQ